jgi:hypothetical protein
MYHIIIGCFLISIRFSRAIIYETSTKQVDFTIESLDDNGSQIACVERLKGFEDDSFTTTCFSRTLNERGVLTACEVTFDDKTCNSCSICETNDDQVGFTLDCYNIDPSENQLQCGQYLNTTIQEILVDEYFAGTSFDFALNTTTSSEDGGNNSSSSVGRISMKRCYVLASAIGYTLYSLIDIF